MKKNLETLLYSAGGVIAAAIILIAANFIISAFNVRADLTDGDVYTLSPGTREILSKLEAPVTLRFYYTQGGNSVPVAVKTFARRVEDLLREYKSASNGKIVIEKFDPQPDSDAEESAQLDNVEGQQTNTGEKFYLGLTVSFLDQKASIPVLAPDRERLLEYDITRAISQVAAAKKPVVGVMSALPVLGRPLNPMAKQQPTEPWVFANELKRSFDVRKVELDVTAIPDDIKVLLVIHPRNIPEATEYAIDQFVLKGGKVIAFVDPYAYFDQQPDMQNPFGGNQAGQSTLYNLLKGWGLDMNLNKVMADLTFASGEGPRLLPTLLSLNNEALNQEDVVTSQVGTLLIPFGGSFSGKPVDGLTQTVLAHTSKNAMPVDLIIATLSGEPSTRGFQPSGKEEPLAIRLSGKFRTAFPNGAPEPPRGTRLADDAKAAPVPAKHLREAAADNSVILVADVDLLTDGRGRGAGNLRPEARRPAQRQPRVRAGLRRTARRRPGAHQSAQPCVVQPAADGDPPWKPKRSRRTSARSSSSRIASSRRRKNCRRCRKARAARRARSCRPSSRPRSRTSARRPSRRVRS